MSKDSSNRNVVLNVLVLIFSISFIFITKRHQAPIIIFNVIYFIIETIKLCLDTREKIKSSIKSRVFRIQEKHEGFNNDLSLKEKNLNPFKNYCKRNLYEGEEE
jgi:hypothetical protein